MVWLLNNRKKRVSCNWIRGINFSLIEGEQLNFCAEKYPFFLQQSSSSPSPQFVSRPASLRLVPNDYFSCIQAGFKSLYQNATSVSIVQCSNLHVHQRVGSCDVNYDSRLGECEFNLLNCQFLYPWSHFTCLTYSCMLWAAVCVISLTICSWWTPRYVEYVYCGCVWWW